MHARTHTNIYTQHIYVHIHTYTLTVVTTARLSDSHHSSGTYYLLDFGQAIQLTCASISSAAIEVVTIASISWGCSED